MAEKRRRGQNFSLEEKDKLVKILLGFKDTILNKKTDGTTNEAKLKSWISVTNTFNSTATVYRNKESLMKVWEKLKSESKVYYNITKQSSKQTGGGPCLIKTDPVLEQVCAILGRGCTGIIGVADCDAEEEISEPLPKIICVDYLPVPTQCEVNLPEVLEIPSEEATHISECTLDKKNEPSTSTSLEINKTPLWSRRRPQLNQKNERTETVSSLCASFQDINNKKKNIEDLKLQLLQDEISFKNQLYKLQLEAARREVEIKTEILAQIKGGGFNLKNLFGVPGTKE